MKATRPAYMLMAAGFGAALVFAVASPVASGRGGHGGFGGGGPNGWDGSPSTQQGEKKTVSQTVDKDQLTSKEVDGLKEQVTALDKAATTTYTGDKALSPDDLDALEETLDSASFFIWSKGTDDNGKVVTLYGKSIFPVDELNKMFANKTLTRPEAKMLVTALKNLASDKLKLNELMTVEGRMALQKEFNAGLAKFYMAK